MKGARRFSTGRIDPSPLTGEERLEDLIDNAFTAYNASRLREGCHLLARKVMRPEVTVGMTLTGALTPGGYGKSCLVPLIERGLVDWIVSTGANLYHDTHHAIGLALHSGTPFADDVQLQEEGVVRIYDIVFDYDVLLRTDPSTARCCAGPSSTPPSRPPSSTTGWAATSRRSRKSLGLAGTSLIAAAYRHAVPVFTSSPGDSSIGMNVAELSLEGRRSRSTSTTT
jgi:deoxyhypusine synthase